MTTLSVPIDNVLEEFIQNQIDDFKAENKAQVVRRALREMREREFWNDLTEAQRDVREGYVYSGDLDELVNKLDKHDRG